MIAKPNAKVLMNRSYVCVTSGYKARKKIDLQGSRLLEMAGRMLGVR